MTCSRRTWHTWLCALLLALGGTSVTLHAESLEAITLQHRLAEDLVPVLRPLMPEGTALTGAGNVLLVRADDATIAQIRAALATLDRPARQLLVTVGQSTGAESRASAVQGSATIGSGDVQVGVNRPPAEEPGAQVVVQGQQARADVHSVSSVQTLEGHEAYVTVGQAQPYGSTTVVDGGHGRPVYGPTVEYRDVQTGFFVTPRVDGDRVVLEISPTQQQLGTEASRAAVSTQSITTTVSGRLGEWIELGGVADTRGGSHSGLIRWGSRSDLTQYAAWVKVEEIR